MSTLRHTLTVAHELWPLEGAEAWDVSGLVLGHPDQQVRRILLVVDVTAATVDQAIELRADLVLAHHPFLLRPVSSLTEDTHKGALIARLIRANIALLSAHTNADVVPEGVSDVLAATLGIQDALPIVASSPASTHPGSGIGRVGTLATPLLLGDLARLVASTLPATAQGVRVAGDYAHPVQRVALCGGAGDSLLEHPLVREADVYITSDLRHHRAQDAREQAAVSGGPALIDVSHWAAEWLWLEKAAEALAVRLPEVDVVVSDLRTDPWDFVVVQ
jgi:dinuclear metal center YbgI/SA1388 family protein